ncbi:MAG: type II toxin-antitoxin system VapC family toxin [Nocardioides sp.]
MTGTACDTSVLVPALSSWHPSHGGCRAALADVTSLPLQVLIESYSVLTRFPPPHRVSAADAAAVLRELSVEIPTLPGDQARDLINSLARQGIAGGAVYDAVVAATARHYGLHLISRDLRARAIYDAVGVRYTLV